jgi:hypothetical protein
MPKTKKMCGYDSDSSSEDGKGLRVRMSKAQHRTLKRGGKITLKPEMLDKTGDFIPMAENLIKKAKSAMTRGKGIRIARDPSGIPSNSEALLGEAVPQPQMGGKGYRFGDFLNDIRPVTDFLRPLAEAGRDKGVEKIKGYGMERTLFKKIRGKGYHFADFLNDIRPVTDFVRPLAEAARDKGVDKIKGYGIHEMMFKKMRGKGYRFTDFLNDIRPVTDFVRPLAEAARDKGVDKIKGYGMSGCGKLTITHDMDGGSFMAAGAIGSTAGNSGMLQLGSPYQHPNSPAMNPFIPQHSQLSGTNKLSTHKSSRIYRK